MFFSSTKAKIDLTQLVTLTREMKQQANNRNYTPQLLWNDMEHEQLQEIAMNLSEIIDTRQMMLQRLSDRLQIMTDSVTVGFWEMTVAGQGTTESGRYQRLQYIEKMEKCTLHLYENKQNDSTGVSPQSGQIGIETERDDGGQLAG